MSLPKTGQIPLIALITLIGAGCTQPIRSWDLADPIMYANQNSECDSDNPDCRYNTGLLLAVWPDGRVLRAESADTIGLRYIVGLPTTDQSNTVMLAVDQLAGLADTHDQIVTPGSASHHVVVPTGAELATSWRFEIPVKNEQSAYIEERLITIMQTELHDQRSVHWSNLPRFDSPVIGNWRSVHDPR